MNRRGFLSFLGAAAVVPLVPVPELLLPTRTIFLPPRGGWLGRNQLFTATYIANEALRILHENVRYTEFYDIGRDELVCRHDALLSGEQLSVDQLLSASNTPKQAGDRAASMLLDVVKQRRLSTIDIQRPPSYR